MNFDLLISSSAGSTLFRPAAVNKTELTLERRSCPGKLAFEILPDKSLNFSEGSSVRLSIDGRGIFSGFVFSQKRSKDGIISVTAYDQLRYLNNKDTCVYSGKTASQLIAMLCADFGLKTGNIADTKYVIPSMVEENTALFDMIENALDLTLQNTGEMYVMYDDSGKITLKNVSDMYVENNGSYLLIDSETGENFSYSSSIDDSTYNQVKLIYDNKKKGIRNVYVSKDSSNISRWGLLQYFGTLKEGENGSAKAEALLKIYNSKTRRLKISKAFGDVRVRAGSVIAVKLNLGDTEVNNFMIVEKVRHCFAHDEHFMDLTLTGGGFVA